MRILIVKTSSLGDIIHAFSALDYLKQSRPDCEIDWVVERPFAELVLAHPLVHQVIVIQTKKWRKQIFERSSWKEIARFCKELRTKSYDFILDLQGNFKSSLVTGLAKGCTKIGFGYSSVAEWPNLLVTHKKYNPPLGFNIREDYLFLVKKAVLETDVDYSPEAERVQLSLSASEKLQLAPLLDQLDQVEGIKILFCLGSNWANKQLSTETV